MDYLLAIEMRKSGKTYQEIGDIVGVSRQRVEQVLKKHGASGRFPKKKQRIPKTESQKRILSIEAFWKNVDKKGEDECWNWIGPKVPSGYGVGCVMGKRGYAHRIAYKLVKGEIPDGFNVCHSCDNPSCCNPNHLWAGTQKENIDDRECKGHHKGWKNTLDFYGRRRREIFKMREAGFTQRAIGEKFGISQPQVNSILHSRGKRSARNVLGVLEAK